MLAEPHLVVAAHLLPIGGAGAGDVDYFERNGLACHGVSSSLRRLGRGCSREVPDARRDPLLRPLALNRVQPRNFLVGEVRPAVVEQNGEHADQKDR